MRLIRLLAPALTATLGAGLLAPVAAASEGDRPSIVRLVDSRHDVWFLDDGFAKPRRRLDPGRRDGDITSIRVAHRLERIMITLAERAIPRPRKRDFEVTPIILIKTSAQQRFVLIVLSAPAFGPAEAILLTDSGDFVECSGVRFRTHLGAPGTVRLSVPRSCLGNPRWVKAQAATAYPFAQSLERSYVDVAPGRRLMSHQKTPQAFAPAAAATRAVAPRLAPRHRSLPADLDRLLRRLDLLR